MPEKSIPNLNALWLTIITDDDQLALFLINPDQVINSFEKPLNLWENLVIHTAIYLSIASGPKNREEFFRRIAQAMADLTQP